MLTHFDTIDEHDGHRTDGPTDRQTPHDGMDRACASRGKVAESSQLVVTTELKDIEPQPHEVQTGALGDGDLLFVCSFVCSCVN